MEYLYAKELDENGTKHPLDYISTSDSLICYCSVEKDTHKEVTV